MKLNNKVTFNSYNKEIILDFPNEKDYERMRINQNNNFYERKTLKSIKILINKYPKTVIDIGAYIGNHTVFFSKICNAKKVISFEPQKIPFTYLKKNCKINKVDNIELHNIALGKNKSKGIIKESFEPNHDSARGIKIDKKGDIDIFTLDSFKFKDIDLIKMDVEGMESDVIKGALQTIKKYKPLIITECNSNGDIQNINNLLSKEGYKPIHSVEYNIIWRYKNDK